MASAPVYSVVDVAKLCQVTPQTVRMWIDAGRLVAYRVPGGEWRVSRPYLVDFFRRSGVAVPAELAAQQQGEVS